MTIVSNYFRKSIAVIIFILVWEVASRTELVSPLFVPAFTTVLDTLTELFISGHLINHVGISLFRALAGFAVAVVVGLPLGLLLGGWFHNVKTALDPLMQGLAQVNPFMLFHIVLLFLGIGEVTKVTIIAWSCVWPVVFATVDGIKNIDSNLLKAARSFGLGPWQLFLKVALPAAAPSIFTGLRLSAGHAFFLLVAAEVMGSSSGLGWMILNSQENFQIAKIFAVSLVIALLGLVIDLIMEAIQNRVLIGEEIKSVIKSQKTY